MYIIFTIIRGGFFGYYGDLDYVGFTLFGFFHIATLVFSVFLILAVCHIYKGLKSAKRLKMIRVIASIIVIMELVQQFSFPILHGMVVIEYLPFQLCGLMIIVITIYAISPDRFGETAGEILYALGLAGFAAALIFPNWTMYPIMNFYNLKSFFIHGLQMAFVLMLVVSGEIRPSPKKIKRPVLFLAIVVPPIYIFNLIAGTNFMFVNAGSPGSPLEVLVDTFGNPGFLIPYAGLVVLVLFLMYLPWYLKDRRSLKP